MFVSEKVPLSLVTTGMVFIPHVCLTESTIISVTTGVVFIPHVCLTERTIISGHYRDGLYTPCVSHRKYHYLCHNRGGFYTPGVSHWKYHYLCYYRGVFIPHVCLTESTIISVTTGVVFIPHVCLTESTIISVTTGVVSIPHLCLTESTIISGHYRGGLYSPCVSCWKYHCLWSLQGWSLFSMCVSQKVPLSLLLQGWSLYPMCVSQKFQYCWYHRGGLYTPWRVLQKVPLPLMTIHSTGLPHTGPLICLQCFVCISQAVSQQLVTAGWSSPVQIFTAIRSWLILCFFLPPPPPPFSCHWPKCDCTEQSVVCCYQPVYGRNKTCWRCLWNRRMKAGVVGECWSRTGESQQPLKWQGPDRGEKKGEGFLPLISSLLFQCVIRKVFLFFHFYFLLWVYFCFLFLSSVFHWGSLSVQWLWGNRHFQYSNEGHCSDQHKFQMTFRLTRQRANTNFRWPAGSPG